MKAVQLSSSPLPLPLPSPLKKKKFNNPIIDRQINKGE